ncbi:bacteriocin biosynthesis cyclodehydratase domain-containing protein [Agromyces terreus]|uniref:Bacteriocin biosynthesis cyclodehydratase domain-containing protein n=1 Tax=Agromyces terreus TaxID=424795 RepID=A0A9X2KCE9_9MICO|nr:bacteriocin biosynthesis cyclodehydratase domain-containing protein [Agromyces terreus]
MTPRLDPALPLVWRTPDTLQLGAASARVVIERPGPLEIGLLQALRHGVEVPTLVTIASGLDGTPRQVHEFLDRLAPACVSRRDGADAAESAADVASTAGAPASAAPAATAPAAIEVDGAGELADAVATGLRTLGHDARTPDRAPATEPTHAALVVIVADWAVAPVRYLPLMRHDVPHLVVLGDDAGIRVGPLVEPGTGACVRCLDLARRDEDSAWPVIAAQLAGRPAPDDGPRLRFEAAIAAARAADDYLRRGESRLIGASVSFDRSRLASHRRDHGMHPLCGCRAPGGIAIPNALPDAARRPSPSSARAVDVPA